MSGRLFSFEYRPRGTDWTPRPASFKTANGAFNAARKYKADMALESCDVEIRVVELIPDGRNGRVARVL